VPESFGPGLPLIRDWTEQHFEFSGYITGFVPPTDDERKAIRHELGYGEDEKVCIVTVGGSGVGRGLLERVLASQPMMERQLPGLRMVVVAGPRIDPASLSAPEGVEVRAYVPELHRHLAIADLALVQGGLTTTMELAAARRPFLYFPLKNHFEQNLHVRQRLDRYGAGHLMDFDTSDPDAIAAAAIEEMNRPVTSLPVETDGAKRAAASISTMF
jgi:predicted glycosyltransferase